MTRNWKSKTIITNNLQDYDWTKIFDMEMSESDEESVKDAEVSPLVDLGKNTGSNTGPYHGMKLAECNGYIGFTLNYPRTVKFLNSNSSQQKVLYALWVRHFKNTFGPLPDNADYKVVFEYCASGQIHCHGYLPLNGKYFIMGALSDLAKALLSFLPPKYSQFKEGSVYPEFFRIRSAAYCLQYYSNDPTVEGPSGIEYWRRYIQKMQN